MAFKRGSQRRLSYIKELVIGTTPATPAMTTLRNTGDSITLSRESFTSNELRSDRAVTDLTLGNKQTGGGIDFELSVENFDLFMAMALYSADDLPATLTGETGFITNGVTERSVTIEKSFATATDAIYEVFTGVHVNTLSLNVAVNSQITGSLDLLGTGYSSPVASLDATPTDARSGGLFDSYNLALSEGGSDIGGVGLSLALNINNNLSPAFALGSISAQEVIDGRCAVDGTLQIYFANKTIYEKFANDTESSITLALDSTKGTLKTTYTIELPRVKYTAADNPVSDEGAVNVSMPFTALQDDAGYTIKITKSTVTV